MEQQSGGINDIVYGSNQMHAAAPMEISRLYTNLIAWIQGVWCTFLRKLYCRICHNLDVFKRLNKRVKITYKSQKNKN